MDLGGLFKPKNGKNPQKMAADKPSAIPVLNQVMSAASGATYAFSGVSRHVNDSLKKIEAKSVEIGKGRGGGSGHRFGVGLSLKPGVVQQFQLYLFQAVGKMMTKFGASQNLSIVRRMLPTSLPSGTSMKNQVSLHNPIGNMMQFGEAAENPIQGLLGRKDSSKGHSNEKLQSPGVLGNSSFSTRTEKVISSFLQNPALREDTGLNETDDGQLQSENRMLSMVLKHEQVIAELVKENEELRRILVEDLKISPDKLRSSKSKSTCSDCFECRKKQRRN